MIAWLLLESNRKFELSLNRALDDSGLGDLKVTQLPDDQFFATE
jgi:hypothetical protein